MPNRRRLGSAVAIAGALSMLVGGCRHVPRSDPLVLIEPVYSHLDAGPPAPWMMPGARPAQASARSTEPDAY